jgi:hypothetical protein
MDDKVFVIVGCSTPAYGQCYLWYVVRAGCSALVVISVIVRPVVRLVVVRGLCGICCESVCFNLVATNQERLMLLTCVTLPDICIGLHCVLKVMTLLPPLGWM